MTQTNIARLLQFFLWVIILTYCEGNDSLGCIQNDNFCDCGDDETGTSACSMLPRETSGLFQCSDTQYMKQSIYTSRVHDTICDCCDGSDEVGIECEYTCRKMAELEEEKRRVEELKRKAGAEIKESRLQQAKLELKDVRETIDKISTLLPKYNELIEAYKSELVIAQEELLTEESVAAVTLSASIKTWTSNSGQSSRALLINLISAFNLLSGEAAVETVLKELYDIYELPGEGPDDTDALVLAINDQSRVHADEFAVNADGSVQINENNIAAMGIALGLHRVTDENLWRIFNVSLKRAHEKSVLTKSLIYASLSPDTPFSEQLRVIGERISETKRDFGVSVASSERIKEIEKKISDTQVKIESFDANLKDARNILSVEYGPDNFLYHFRGKCFQSNDKEYVYDICPTGSAKQNSVTVLGNYGKYTLGEQGQIQLHLLNGQYCHATRQSRTLTLYLQCDENEEIGNVLEPDICTYAAVFFTPMAC